jgi:hypothetical protein
LHQFNHKNQNAGINRVRLLAICLIAAGLIVLLVPFFFEVDTDSQKIGLVGGGAFLIGMLLISIYSGTLIDFQKHRFREYQSILWFKFGKWEALPRIEHVELIHHSFRSTNTPNGISPTLSQQVTIYKCVLLSNSTKFLALDYTKEKDAIADLEEIREGLGI